MKQKPNPPSTERVEELLFQSRTHPLTPEERKELNAVLREDERARAHAARTLADNSVLADELRVQQVGLLLEPSSDGLSGLAEPLASLSRRHRRFEWRTLAPVAAGIAVGLTCATMAWALVAAPRESVSAERLFTLEQGNFENMTGPVASGFPSTTRVWSGDKSEVVEQQDTPKDGSRRRLRFIRAEGDPNLPDSPANSSDVFQLVDLRFLKTKPAGDSVLELSAEFSDARAADAPILVLGCHVYLFQGDPGGLHQRWPQILVEALGSGAALVESRGASHTGQTWTRVISRCVLSPQTDFAVVHLSAGRPLRAGSPKPELGAVFARDVQLTVKTQPDLPVKVVQR